MLNNVKNHTQANVLVYMVNKTYGGREYVEINHELGLYSKGSTRAHNGHQAIPHIEVKVNSKKALDETIKDLERLGYNRVSTLYEIEEQGY